MSEAPISDNTKRSLDTPIDNHLPVKKFKKDDIPTASNLYQYLQKHGPIKHLRVSLIDKALDPQALTIRVTTDHSDKSAKWLSPELFDILRLGCVSGRHRDQDNPKFKRYDGKPRKLKASFQISSRIIEAIVDQESTRSLHDELLEDTLWCIGDPNYERENNDDCSEFMDILSRIGVTYPVGSTDNTDWKIDMPLFKEHLSVAYSHCVLTDECFDYIPANTLCVTCFRN